MPEGRLYGRITVYKRRKKGPGMLQANVAQQTLNIARKSKQEGNLTRAPLCRGALDAHVRIRAV